MENQLIIQNEFVPSNVGQVNGNIAVDQSKAASEVLGAIMSAKRFPRDSFTAFNNIRKECQRYSLANCALYKFPRGGTTVAGPSIRLAEVVARQWGNIDCGIREIEREDGRSIMQAYAWDLETNYRVTRNFTVEHIRDTKNGSKALTDQRDIYEMTANQGARRLRACILQIIPGDVVDMAEDEVKKTIAKGPGNMTREDRVRNIVSNFDKYGIALEHIEKRIGHDIKSISDDEILDLVSVYNSIKDNVAKRTEFFDLGELVQGETTKLLNEMFTANQSGAKNAQS